MAVNNLQVGQASFESILDSLENGLMQLADASTRIQLNQTGSVERQYVGFFARIFGPNETIREQVRNDALTIKQSLTRRVGQENAATLYERHLQKDVSHGKITIGNLRNLFSEIKKYEYSSRIIGGLPLKESVAKMKNGIAFFGESVLQVLDTNASSEAMLRRTLGISERLIHNVVYGEEAVSRDLNRIDQTIEKLGSFLRMFRRTQNADFKPLTERLAKLQIALLEKKVQYEEQAQSNPFAAKNVVPFLKARFSAGVHVLRSQIKQLEAQEPVLWDEVEKLNLAQVALRENVGLSLKQYEKLRVKQLDKTQIQKMKELSESIETTVRQALGSLLDEKELQAKFTEGFKQALNKGDWNEIRREIDVVQQEGENRTPEKIVSTMKPANQIGKIGADMALEGIRGVSSVDTTNVHAVNLWETQLTRRGKTLFKGIRHGVLDAFGIEDETRRHDANINRAKEVFTAALESRPDLLTQARNAGPDEEIQFDIVSTSLLTPMIKSFEYSKFKHQTEAWKNACGPDGTVQLQVSDGNNGFKTVKVRPNVVTFNFTVDSFGTLPFGLTWGAVKSSNKEALTALVGPLKPGQTMQGKSMVEKFLDTLDPDNTEDREIRAKIHLLTSQIKQMYLDDTYRTKGYDPYALPARIALLTYLIGATSAFNCKSGKDRTAQLDVVVKTLAYQLDASMDNTDYHKVSGLQFKQMKQIAINSGQHEVQQLNTGLAGNKIANGQFLPSGVAIPFDPSELDYYAGLGREMEPQSR